MVSKYNIPEKTFLQICIHLSRSYQHRLSHSNENNSIDNENMFIWAMKTGEKNDKEKSKSQP